MKPLPSSHLSTGDSRSIGAAAAVAVWKIANQKQKSEGKLVTQVNCKNLMVTYVYELKLVACNREVATAIKVVFSVWSLPLGA